MNKIIKYIGLTGGLASCGYMFYILVNIHLKETFCMIEPNQVILFSEILFSIIGFIIMGGITLSQLKKDYYETV